MLSSHTVPPIAYHPVCSIPEDIMWSVHCLPLIQWEMPHGLMATV